MSLPAEDIQPDVVKVPVAFRAAASMRNSVKETCHGHKVQITHHFHILNPKLLNSSTPLSEVTTFSTGIPKKNESTKLPLKFFLFNAYRASYFKELM